jgi:outer membrane lipoprotein-sorting protein
MKRLISLVVGAMALAAALAVGAPNEANGQSAGLVSAVLSRLEQNHANLKSLRSAISMQKYDSQLRETEDYYGVVLYVPASGRNAFVRLEWSKPQHEILTVANGRYTLFRPRLNVAYTGNAGSSKNKTGSILSLMNMSGNELRARFQPFQDVREEKLWGGVSTTHLKLVPKGPESFKYAEVWIDSSGMPVQFKTVEKNDDATTVRLNNLEKNLKLSLDQFVVKLDSSVKVIKG